MLEREKRALSVASVPIICIALIGLFHIVMVHVPYFGGDCRRADCVAGAIEQFVMWSVLFILIVYGLSQMLFGGCKSALE
jgi:hypothetical protein